MFGFDGYIDKLNTVQWYFEDDMKKDLEDLFFVTFIKHEEYYTIKSVIYSYFDILEGLKMLDFIITKKNDIIIIQIL